MDSATLLGLLLDQGAEVHCCQFLYGSKHSAYESQAAVNIVNFYLEKGFPVHLEVFDLRQSFVRFTSALLKSGGEIPEGNYTDESMKQTVVPGRNLIFISLMAGYAESIGAEEVALGVHSGDHAIYYDCRPEFITAAREVVRASTGGKVNIIAPVLAEDKTSILVIGMGLNPPVPFELSRTCYKDQAASCGKCGSCSERLEAFKNLGLKDPILYE
jgi:7-cyano-7-deazaguanine synthase